MNNETLVEIIDARNKRRANRRDFMRTAASAAVAVGGVAVLSACGDNNNDLVAPPPPPPPPVAVTPPPPPPAPAAIGDPEILNFALNLEYLEAEFYSYAVYGVGLEDALTGGPTARGAVTPGKRVNFADRIVAEYAVEIVEDERTHVRFLRDRLGAAAVSRPAIDVGFGPTSAFSAAARAGGIIGAGQSFDPYADDNSFLLGAFIFEDVGVTAYQGAARLISNLDFLEAAAGILAAEAYHAGLIRTLLTRRGATTPQIINTVEQISGARNNVDGPTNRDQGIIGTADASNIVPTDANSLTFSRSAAQVLNIAYLTGSAATSGGFFPSGVNGVIRESSRAF